MKNKEKFPLFEIMTCLLCGNTIIPHFGKRYRYYRCGGYHKKCCNSSVIKAELIESKIRDIVIENIHLFVFYTEFIINNNHINELRKRKNAIVKRCKDGFPPEYVNINPSNDIFIYNDMKELNEIDNEINLTSKGKRPIPLLEDKYIKFPLISEDCEINFIEEYRQLLLSKKNLEINDLYKDLLKIEVNIKEKYGLIRFLSIKQKREGNLYYRFSL